jgi:TolA-binding protein/TM2 domain-containing membrane protein YozV
MNRVFFLAGILLAIVTVSPASPNEPLPAGGMDFANHLYQTGDYYRAITEYERFAFTYPDHPTVKLARYQIAMSYFMGQKWDQATDRFRSIFELNPNEETGKRSLFMLGEVYLAKKDYLRAITVFKEYLSAYPDDDRRDAARIQIGRCQLWQGDWRLAEETFRSNGPDSPFFSQSQGLAAGAREFPLIPKKNPILAGTLSAILPGAGQLYIGRTTDAVISFLLNGIFIWGAVESFHKGNNVAGGILLAFESGWYLGNIYNATSGAYKYNRRAEGDYINQLENQYRVSLRRDRDGKTTVVLNLDF